MEAQGYQCKSPPIYQDSMSTILLAKNGRISSSEWTRHINVRYFFINYKIVKKEVKVVYCPTDNMVADMFKKPLQGSLFKKFRDEIMNVQKDASCPHGVTMLHRSVLRKYNRYSMCMSNPTEGCKKMSVPIDNLNQKL